MTDARARSSVAAAAIDASVLEWVVRNLSMVREIMAAEQLVKFGRVELHYRNGRYIGLDTVCRNRGARDLV